MDFHLKPWRDQQQHQLESEATEPNQQQEVEQSSVSSVSANAASTPKLFLESPYSQPSSSSTAAAAGGSATTTLPLFVPEGRGVQQRQRQQQEVKEEQDSAHPLTEFTNLSSAFPSSDHHSAPCRFPRNTNNRSYNCNNMESYFSLAQWQELELQALIYRYIVAGAAVPPELLQPIYFLHSNFSTPHHPPAAALLHPGYWGRAAMDPEPGRCRRTDGKKWRCSRDVVAGQKYCERHVHRGRNRSRKPVEIPSPGDSATAIPIKAAGAAPISAVVAAGGSSRLSFSRSSSTSSIDMLCLNQSYTSDVKANSKAELFRARNHVDSRTDRHVLHHFFDDWPRSLQESNTGTSESDVSLKLSTGNGNGNEPTSDPDRDQLPLSTWAARWSSNQVASMGSPLAEALRPPATTAHSSPTSVLNPLPRGSTTEASSVRVNDRVVPG